MQKIDHIFERKDDRGIFNEYLNQADAWKAVNGGSMKEASILGNHYHKKCRTAFFVTSGKAEVWYKNLETNGPTEHFELETSQGCIFEPYETHAIRFSVDSTFLLLKTENFNPSDQDIFPAALI